MKRFVPLSLVASAVLLCVSAGAGQAATLTGAGGHPAMSAHASTLVSKAGWHRHHRCWWRHHRRHCRYWR